MWCILGSKNTTYTAHSHGLQYDIWVHKALPWRPSRHRSTDWFTKLWELFNWTITFHNTPLTYLKYFTVHLRSTCVWHMFARHYLQKCCQQNRHFSTYANVQIYVKLQNKSGGRFLARPVGGFLSKRILWVNKNFLGLCRLLVASWLGRWVALWANAYGGSKKLPTIGSSGGRFLARLVGGSLNKRTLWVKKLPGKSNKLPQKRIN